jgi:hypothetical protein
MNSIPRDPRDAYAHVLTLNRDGRSNLIGWFAYDAWNACHMYVDARTETPDVAVRLRTKQMVCDAAAPLIPAGARIIDHDASFVCLASEQTPAPRVEAGRMDGAS